MKQQLEIEREAVFNKDKQVKQLKQQYDSVYKVLRQRQGEFNQTLLLYKALEEAVHDQVPADMMFKIN